MPALFHKLGKGGPEVTAIGFGLMGMSGSYGAASDNAERFKVLDRALELGQTFWDTSDFYGDNEDFLGEWFKKTGNRNKIFLATKFGISVTNGQFVFNSSAENCRKCCEASLKRLGIDSIDLYYAHRLNPEIPVEETMRELAKLKAEGKIKNIGLSEISSASLRRACKIAPVAAVQMEYSPFEREIEHAAGTDLLATCRELGVSVVAYSPLGRGLLTGAFSTKESISGASDTRSGVYYPRFQQENIDKNAKIVEQFKAFADKNGCTTSQLAIAWLLKQGDDIIPIPGTKKIKYLEENWGAQNVNLADEDVAEIRKFLESNEMAGSRLMDSFKDFTYIDTKEES